MKLTLSTGAPIELRLSATSRHAKRPKRAAFTLIELLTVIAIIAILMGLLFPAVGAVKENARKVQAKGDITSIVTAVKSYYTEYGKYPPLDATLPAATDPDLYVGDSIIVSTVKGNNVLLMNTLRAINAAPNTDDQYNPRRIVFLEGKSATSTTAPKGGFLDKDPVAGGSSSTGAPLVKGCFYDPWGKQYFVMMDTNYDNAVDLQLIYTTDYNTTTRPRTGVVAWSVGKDNNLGYTASGAATGNGEIGTQVSKAADDVLSWQ